MIGRPRLAPGCLLSAMFISTAHFHAFTVDTPTMATNCITSQILSLWRFAAVVLSSVLALPGSLSAQPPTQGPTVPRPAPDSQGPITDDPANPNEMADAIAAACNLGSTASRDPSAAPNAEELQRIFSSQLASLRNRRILLGRPDFPASWGTSSNTCTEFTYQGQAPQQVYWFDRRDPSNYQRVSPDDWGPPAGGPGGGPPRYCPKDALRRVIVGGGVSSHMKNLILASVIAHEGKHCEQDRKPPPTPPGGNPPHVNKAQDKEYYCREIEAHDLQIAFLKKAYLWMIAQGLLSNEPGAEDTKAYDAYLKWLETERARLQVLKDRNA